MIYRNGALKLSVDHSGNLLPVEKRVAVSTLQGNVRHDILLPFYLQLVQLAQQPILGQCQMDSIAHPFLIPVFVLILTLRL